MRSLEQIVALLPWCSSVCLSVRPSSVCVGRACIYVIVQGCESALEVSEEVHRHCLAWTIMTF